MIEIFQDGRFHTTRMRSRVQTWLSVFLRFKQGVWRGRPFVNPWTRHTHFRPLGQGGTVYSVSYETTLSPVHFPHENPAAVFGRESKLASSQVHALTVKRRKYKGGGGQLSVRTTISLTRQWIHPEKRSSETDFHKKNIVMGFLHFFFFFIKTWHEIVFTFIPL